MAYTRLVCTNTLIPPKFFTRAWFKQLRRNINCRWYEIKNRNNPDAF